jgi:predicted phosphodiesterase
MAIEKIINNHDLSYAERYTQITSKQTGNESARKRLYGMRDFIDVLKRNEPGDVNYSKYTPENLEDERNIEIRKDGSRVSSRIIPIKVDESVNEAEQKAQDPEFLLRKHGLDPKKFKIDYVKAGNWNTQRKHGSIIVLFSSKIKASPIKDDIAWCELAEYLDEKIKSKPPKVEFKHKDLVGNYLYEVSTADVHLGKLGWEPESGENYDIKIASNRFRDIVSYHCTFIKNNGSIEKILFVVGNDFFHYDNNKQTTDRGTFQHTDIRWPKMFKYGFDLNEWALEQLSQFAPVEVLLVPGNHDLKTSYYLAFALNKRFRNNDNITIDIEPKRRKYIKYGNTLIGFAHGSELNKKEKLTVMQQESPDWSDTQYHEFHFGHLHRESMFEHGNIIFRDLSTITGTDSWHYGKGYIGAIKKSQGFLYHKKAGLKTIENAVINI